MQNMDRNRWLRLGHNELRIGVNWIWLPVVLAWAILLIGGYPSGQVLSHMTGSHSSHDLLYQTESTLTLSQSLFKSLGHWEIMIIAMMLPSVLPVTNAFIKVSEDFTDRLSAQLAFVFSYIAVWTIFSVIMIGISMMVPYFSIQINNGLNAIGLPALSKTVIQAVTLMGVGSFQFTSMKRSCLKGCRSAALLIAQYYRPGWQGGWNLGWQNGLYCLGCCWALMLSMAIVGMENLTFMLVLTAVMTLERTWKYGEWVAVGAGVGLMGWGGYQMGWVLLSKLLIE